MIENLDWAFDTIRWRARRRYSTFTLDPEDLRSMAHMALVQCVRRYDPASGASFRTFSARRVTGILDDSLRRNGYANATAAPLVDAGATITLPVDRIHAEAASPQLKAARSHLDPLSRAVVCMLYEQNCGVDLAARRLGVSVARIEAFRRHAMRLMRRSLEKSSDKIVSKKSWTIFRLHVGRPPKVERCACGEMTRARAEARYHEC